MEGWSKINADVKRAKQSAFNANRPARGRRWPTHRITVDQYCFHYRGEVLTIKGDNNRFRTIKELKSWRSKVNMEKSSR